jgi:hypothetical protein
MHFACIAIVGGGLHPPLRRRREMGVQVLDDFRPKAIASPLQSFPQSLQQEFKLIADVFQLWIKCCNM